MITEAYGKVINMKTVRRRETLEKYQERQKKENQWFLSHFPVTREGRTTAKVGIVFYAAVQHNNDSLFHGPNLQI